MTGFPDKGDHPKGLLEPGIREFREVRLGPYRIVRHIPEPKETAMETFAPPRPMVDDPGFGATRNRMFAAMGDVVRRHASPAPPDAASRS